MSTLKSQAAKVFFAAFFLLIGSITITASGLTEAFIPYTVDSSNNWTTSGRNIFGVAPVSMMAAAATLDQCRNGGPLNGVYQRVNCSGSAWVNGNAGAQNSHFVEGHSIPYRAVMTGIPTGPPITLELGYDIKHSGAHAIDYLTHYQRLEPHQFQFGHPAEIVSPISGVAGLSTSVATCAIPPPSSAGSPVAGMPAASFNALTTNEKKMTVFGATSCSVSYGPAANLNSSQAEQTIFVTFTADSTTAVMAWGGHIARSLDWGDGNAAGGISGSPYHMRLKNWGLGNLGNQDRSLSAAAVLAPGTVTVQKNTGDANANSTFTFSSTGSGLNSSFNITTSAGTASTPFADVPAGVKTISEILPSGWQFVSVVCNDPDVQYNGQTATISVSPFEDVTCVFTNSPNAELRINKSVASVNGGPANGTITAAGQVISYSITATNSGNGTLTGVTVVDPLLSNLSCTWPGTAGTLAPGASVTCTGSYTVPQSVIDSNGGGDGDIDNTATADSAQTNPVSASAAVPVDPSPAIEIVKTGVLALGTNQVANAGDVITYTFMVTNKGNTTLSNVNVTDPLAGLSAITCTGQSNGSITLAAPNGSISCSATYAITQADIDAGSRANLATACSGTLCDTDDENVPVPKGPAIEIVKTGVLDVGQNGANPGDVITYTFVVTNTGNTTLSNVTVADPLPGLSAISCVGGGAPPNAHVVASLAPGNSFNCSATYAITQADINAGNRANLATACSGTTCDTDDENVPVPQAPGLSIVKVADRTSYNAVNQVINYTITATNSGNTTLTNVTVTDPNVSNLSCNPTNGSNTVAPGGTVVCTASHTVTQADIDAGNYANQACVNAATATQACDDVDVPANPVRALTLTKTARIKTITYSFVITNVGNTTLSTVGLTDPLFISENNPTGQVSGCTAETLAPNATAVCEADYTVTEQDYVNGYVTNIATATAAGPVITTATVTITPLTVVSATPTPTPTP